MASMEYPVQWLGWKAARSGFVPIAAHQALQAHNVMLTTGDRQCQGWCPGVKGRSVKLHNPTGAEATACMAQVLGKASQQQNVTFLEAVKLWSRKKKEKKSRGWLGTGPEYRCRAFNLPVMGKMEEDKIPILPFLRDPMWSHCNTTEHLGSWENS